MEQNAKKLRNTKRARETGTLYTAPDVGLKNLDSGVLIKADILNDELDGPAELTGVTEDG